MNKLVLKKLAFLLAVSITLLEPTRAQLEPQYTQFMFNKLAYNPASAGNTYNDLYATLMNRGLLTNADSGVTSTTGLPPSYLYAAVNSIISMKGGGLLRRIGAGISFSKARSGFETVQVPKLSLSYSQPVGSSQQISLGISYGWMQRSYDGTLPNAGGSTALPTELVNGSAPDIDLGLFYRHDGMVGKLNGLYAGFSATHVNQSTIQYSWGPGAGTTVQNKIHLYAEAGAGYFLTDGTMLAVNLQVRKYEEKSMATYDAIYNCLLIFNERLRAGVSRRGGNVISLIGGYEFPFRLFVGYSFDFKSSNTINYHAAVHELALRYRLNRAAPYVHPPRTCNLRWI